MAPWLVEAATSPLVAGCSATLLVLYLAMAFAPDTAGLLLPLVFSNAYTNHFFIWTVLTASFTESSLSKLLLDVALLSLAARLLAGLLDPLRLALFTLLVAVGSALLTSVCIFTGYVITRWEDLFFAPTYGFAGVLCGYFVLLKQRVPTAAALPGGAFPAFRAHHLPFAWLCATGAARLLLGGVEGAGGLVSDFPLAFWALFVSWAYLRFFQHHPDGSVGDGGVDDFQFIMLFPRAAQPCLGPLANFGYGLSLLCGLCRDRELTLAARLLDEDEGDDGAASSLGDVAGALSKLRSQQQQPGSGGHGASAAGQPQQQQPQQHKAKKLGATKSDPVAERRKAKAMQVLDARLKSMEQQDKQRQQQQQQKGVSGKGEEKGGNAVEEDDDLEASRSVGDR